MLDLHTSLYYPYFNIPESTLVHALLFQDSITRIVPPFHALPDRDAQEAELPEKICKQILGEDFILQGNYHSAKEKISGAICDFLREASSTDGTEEFDEILGKNYKDTLKYRSDTVQMGGTQYFVHPHKFDDSVFSILEELGWMRYHERTYACEMRASLCQFYMAVLACAIAKDSGDPIITDVLPADEMISKTAFGRFFPDLGCRLPTPENGFRKICISLLLNGGGNDQGTAIDQLITYRQAAQIRCGVDKYRKDFLEYLDRMILEASIVAPDNLIGALEAAAPDVRDAALEFENVLRKEVRTMASERERERWKNFRTGLSVTLPVLGTSLEMAYGGASLGVFSYGGALAGVAVSMTGGGVRAVEPDRKFSSRQNAYLFMNHLNKVVRKNG